MSGYNKSFFSLLPKEVIALTNVEIMNKVFAGKFNGYRFDINEDEKTFLEDFVDAILCNEMDQREYSRHKMSMTKTSRNFANQNSKIIIDAMYLNPKDKEELIKKANISTIINKSVDKDGNAHTKIEVKGVTVLDAIFSIYKRMNALCQRVITEDSSLICEDTLNVDVNRYDYVKEAIKDEGFDNIYVSCIVKKLEEEFSSICTNSVSKKMLQVSIKEVPSFLIKKIDDLNGNINLRNDKRRNGIIDENISRERLREESGLLYYKRRLLK